MFLAKPPKRYGHPSCITKIMKNNQSKINQNRGREAGRAIGVCKIGKSQQLDSIKL